MSSTPLTVLYGGHRKVMRIGANDSMSVLVQMACREFGLNVDMSLVLKHKRTVVDLSQPFRFTGIPQNATLELEEGVVRGRGAAAGGGGGGGGRVTGSGAPGGKVRVAMRLPGGGRVQASFSSETTLAGLLEWWAERGEISRGVMQQGPSLQFMRTTYGAGDLGSKTLRSIGLQTGSAMFTLSLASPGVAPAPAAGAAAVNGDASLTAQEEADIAMAIALSTAEGGSNNRSEVPPLPLMAAPIAAETSAPPLPPTSSEPAAAKPQTDALGLQVDRGVSGGGIRSGGVGGEGVDGVTSQPESAMEVDGRSAAELAKEPVLPTMGLSVCRAALEVMAAGHFDADSAACVITLTKMVDNVLHKPGDARTRKIRCANAAFQQKVGRIRGGVQFLEGVGFVSQAEEAPSQLLGGGGDRVLVLPPDREDPDILRKARGLLAMQAEALGVPGDRMPQPPRAPARPSPATTAAAAAFDPYKPFMTSTAPTPKGPQEQSLTEQRLQELLAKRANVVSGDIPERDVQVTLPNQAATSSAGKGDVTEGTGMAGSSEVGGVVNEDRGGDGGLIAKKVARQIAERKKREDTPFQTKAMREIERLQKATVYRTTIIKVQFPDRVVLQATFASSEGVKDLVSLVQGCFGEAHRDRQFQLYVSPPRVVLKEASSLCDAGLVPAALVYVSWQNVPPAGEEAGAYLKPELTNASNGGGAVAVRPVGVALDGGGAGAEESKSAGGARGGGGGLGRLLGAGRSSGSGGDGKRTGKPSWLKIN